MADLLVGFPTNLTTVSAGTGGNIRVTYAPWELDWEWFDLMAVGHWLANTTTGVSDDIVAKGGSEHLGYWFEISTAFPSANWNTGNDIAPQRQAAINQFTSTANAVAAMANNDYLLLWYSSTSHIPKNFGGAAFAGIGGSVWGMLSRARCNFIVNGRAVRFSAGQAGLNQRANIINFTTFCSTAGIEWSPTGGLEGAGIRCSRLRILGSATAGITFLGPSVGGTQQIDNCFFAYNRNSITIGNFYPVNFWNNTMLFNALSAHNMTAPGAAVRNSVVQYQLATGSCFTNSGNCLNCADSDGTLPVDATNLRNQTPAQTQHFYELARPGNKAFKFDGRIHQDSVLVGRGVAIAGLTRDADGVLRPDPPSIGAYEPRSTAYAPAADIVRGAVKKGAQP